MEKTTYGTTKEILKYSEHYVAISRMIDTTAFATVAAANGGIIPAGTLLTFNDRDRLVKATPVANTTAPISGVLLNDVDITSKDVNAAPALIQGFVDIAKIPVVPPTSQATTIPLVRFLD